MKCLVTGGAGFIGTRLAKKLVQQGNEVVVLDNLTPQVHHGVTNENYVPLDGVHFIYGDVRNVEIVAESLDGVEVVFHLAAQTGVGQSMYEIREYIDCNVKGTASLWEAISRQKDKVRRVILASSRAVYGEGSYVCDADGPVEQDLRDLEMLNKGIWDPICPRCGHTLRPVPTREDKTLKPTSVYGLSKKMQEELCNCVGRAYGVSSVALRFFNVYGAGQSLKNPYTGILTVFFSGIKSGRVPEVYEDGQESRDFVHVDDVVDACILAANAEGVDFQSFNIGSGVALTIEKAAQIIMQQMGMPGKPQISGAFRVGDIRHCYADITASQSRLGYQPRRDFREGIREFLSWAEGEEFLDLLGTASRELRAHGMLRRSGER